MSTILTPVITDQGLQAVFNADNNGLAAKITKVSLGTAGYTPKPNQTRLKEVKNTIGIASGRKVGKHQLHLNILEDSDKSYWVKEVGFYLEDGTLFAVYSHPTKALAYKSPEVDLLLAFDLALTALPANKVTIKDQGVDLNILIAPELAKMATAEITNMYRYIKQKFILLEKGVI
ncbi:phage tail protein [Spartinivicinus poritis]|uniref:Phage tail protein n=1 Tax=Spartinivicinus poritis TaxID=2994640 RepID=A0ABT5UAG9_9GAMM|nr:phage tail protein [Spartinivicinus sp. A2-2]MDE1463353.1 phage tail protein [Spartinivicinus sp. A2-2]